MPEKISECLVVLKDHFEQPVPTQNECLDDRRWWFFLLSSIFTFLVGLLIVLLWRAFSFLCCRKEPEAQHDPSKKEPKNSRQQKQEFEGTFMTEAKDWAGELISGQTTTGRILVSGLTSGAGGQQLTYSRRKSEALN